MVEELVDLSCVDQEKGFVVREKISIFWDRSQHSKAKSSVSLIMMFFEWEQGLPWSVLDVGLILLKHQLCFKLISWRGEDLLGDIRVSLKLRGAKESDKEDSHWPVSHRISHACSCWYIVKDFFGSFIYLDSKKHTVLMSRSLEIVRSDKCLGLTRDLKRRDGHQPGLPQPQPKRSEARLDPLFALVIHRLKTRRLLS